MNILRFVLALTALSLSSLAQAVEVGGILLPDSVSVGGKSLKVNGTAIRAVTFLKVKVYSSALYLENSSQDGLAILNQRSPKQLIAQFKRDVEKEKVESTFMESLGKSIAALGTPGEQDAWKKEAERFKTWIPAFKENDRLVVTEENGKLTITAPGAAVPFTAMAAIAKPVFGMWIGPSADENLRKNLLKL